MEEETRDAKCEKCGHSWKSKSPMIKVSCPCCGDKVKIRDKMGENKEK